MKQLILGTAQLRMKYGINNQRKNNSEEEAYSILDYACNNGVKLLDTAPAYGDSEKIIGNYIKTYGVNFKIFTKLPEVNSSVNLKYHVEKNLESSLYNLSIDKIDYYMIHESKDIFKYPKLVELLYKEKKNRTIDQVGVSLYDVEEVEYILDNNIKVDFIQIPYNIFALRWSKSNIFEKCKSKNISISARSVYLQGLFFANDEKVYKVHKNAKIYLDKLKEFCIDNKISIQQFAFEFVKYNKFIDSILVGCESKKQLEDNICVFNEVFEFKGYMEKFISDNFSKIEKEIYNPSMWFNS